MTYGRDIGLNIDIKVANVAWCVTGKGEKESRRGENKKQKKRKRYKYMQYPFAQKGI